MTKSPALAAAVCAALLSACAPQREKKPDDAKPLGRLIVSAKSVTTEGRTAVLSGTVSSRFAQTVHGVRYVVTISSQVEPPRVLDRWQREVDTTIEPHQTIDMSLDVESPSLEGSKVSFNIVAQPVQVGDHDMPLPDGWK